MKRPFFFPFVFRHRLTLIVFALAILTTSGVSAREWLKSGANAETRSAPQSDVRQRRVEAEVITVLSTGFQPSQITRPRGQFLILIDNRSDLDDLTLRLISVTGQRLREVRQTKEQKTVKQLEDLPPGEYVLTEANHAEWVCRITITPL